MKPPGKEHGNPLARPIQEVKSTLHGEVSKVEGENSGVQAGHLGSGRSRRPWAMAAGVSIRHARTGN